MATATEWHVNTERAMQSLRRIHVERIVASSWDDGGAMRLYGSDERKLYVQLTPAEFLNLLAQVQHCARRFQVPNIAAADEFRAQWAAWRVLLYDEIRTLPLDLLQTLKEEMTETIDKIEGEQMRRLDQKVQP